ncbi:MAG: helix-hairpin-helix domain-containing protein [Deltaproteobacteria bacterium]|nr:helix-hairpin-helix domain-containing protein [Deltaproteobacteria bacterium]
MVAHREAHGPFPSVDALVRVRGVGPATVARIRSVTVAVGRPGVLSREAPTSEPRALGATSVRSGRVDLNTASAARLDTLPGIGPARAAAIVEDRSRNGPFRSVADLDRVPGIGPATLARVAPHATVAAPPGPEAP